MRHQSLAGVTYLLPEMFVMMQSPHGKFQIPTDTTGFSNSGYATVSSHEMITFQIPTDITGLLDHGYAVQQGATELFQIPTDITGLLDQRLENPARAVRRRFKSQRTPQAF